MVRRYDKKRRIDRSQWNPETSKWKAGIEKGVEIKLEENSNILYLGASSGSTISHLVKLTNGKIFGVELSPLMAIRLVRLSEKEKNIFPIFSDVRNIEYVNEKIENERIDILFQDISTPDQLEILKRYAKLVNENCQILLSLKTQSISQKGWKKLGFIVRKKLEEDFEIIKEVELEPFHKKHVFFDLRKK